MLLQRLANPYFDIVTWQEGVNYSRNDHVLVVNALKDCNSSYWYRPYLNDSYKIVLDNLYESPQMMHAFPDPVENCFVLQNQNWFWYHEALLYKKHSYNLYQPTKTYKKLALLPMGLIKKSHSKKFWDKVFLTESSISMLEISDDEESRKDKERLELYAATLSEKGYKVQFVVGYKNRVKEIVRIVNTTEAQLLVMGAHHHYGWKDYFFGETIESVRHKVKIPVLIVQQSS
jgi:nucleotide-binding universal stress UspA family protein